MKIKCSYLTHKIGKTAYCRHVNSKNAFLAHKTKCGAKNKMSDAQIKGNK